MPFLKRGESPSELLRWGARPKNKFIIFWCAFFLLLNFLSPRDTGTNPPSRFATLQAMSKDHTFRIDRFKNYTVDWAQTPDGFYYSNKAPGAMFLAFPFTVLMDQFWPLQTQPEKPSFPGLWYQNFVCLLTQMLPFVWVVILSIRWLQMQGVSSAAQCWVLLAMLFGNTASIFMNSFFGHGLSAWLVLASFLALQYRRYAVFGWVTGFAVLSDYGVVPLLPGLAIAFFVQTDRSHFRSAVTKVIMGALAPAALWIWYHWVCFGSPFNLPQKFQNPKFVDLGAQGEKLWGILSSYPSWENLKGILVGKERGILPTQPWVFLVWFGSGVFLFWKSQRDKFQVPATLLCILAIGFPGLLFMNASFNGWHGGDSPGPRYLSHLFPLMALMGGFVYDLWPKKWIFAFWIPLWVSLVLRALVHCNIVNIQFTPIWEYYLEGVFQHRFRPCLMVAASLIAIVWTIRFVISESRKSTV